MLEQKTIKLFQKPIIHTMANRIVFRKGVQHDWPHVFIDFKYTFKQNKVFFERFVYEKFEFSTPDLDKICRTTLGLPKIAIQQFMEICKRKGIQLSEVEATREAYNLLNLLRTVNGQKPILGGN